MSLVYLAIGSNLGRREENCLRAIRLLEDYGIVVRKRSSIYETEAWGVVDQPRFVNMVIEVETDIRPDDLLKIIKRIEKEVGREETFRWGPRIVDLDILLYDDLISETPGLTIPHPLMHERNFVLRPLVEIVPDKIHPVLKKTVKELLDTLSH